MVAYVSLVLVESYGFLPRTVTRIKSDVVHDIGMDLCSINELYGFLEVLMIPELEIASGFEPLLK